ncbi:hypothetical protein TNCV_2615551 [Trichonephila clavipes]|nr:hypothetical protein TNCV_2615551 [Trichonephila clavipes]
MGKHKRSRVPGVQETFRVLSMIFHQPSCSSSLPEEVEGLMSGRRRNNILLARIATGSKLVSLNFSSNVRGFSFKIPMLSSSKCEELDIDYSSSQKSLVRIIWECLTKNFEISTVTATAKYFLSKFRVLVGAPKAQTNQPNVTEGGAVYRCGVESTSSCAPVPFDVSGETTSSSDNETHLHLSLLCGLLLIANSVLSCFGA